MKTNESIPVPWKSFLSIFRSSSSFSIKNICLPRSVLLKQEGQHLWTTPPKRWGQTYEEAVVPIILCLHSKAAYTNRALPLGAIFFSWPSKKLNGSGGKHEGHELPINILYQVLDFIQNISSDLLFDGNGRYIYYLQIVKPPPPSLALLLFDISFTAAKMVAYMCLSAQRKKSCHGLGEDLWAMLYLDDAEAVSFSAVSLAKMMEVIVARCGGCGLKAS